MGMDVYGKNPTSERGAYFRNNVWYWRPLWDYCLIMHGDLAGKVEHGHSNDGDGLGAEDAAELGRRITDDLESGRAQSYKETYYAGLAELPNTPCEWCSETGIRTDEVGQSFGMPEKALDDLIAALVGRTHGTCNACNGLGSRPHFATNYPFELDNLREFAEFALDCGGFEIW